jgi:hypothetical protein
MNNIGKAVFHEVQPLRNWWIWLLILIPVALAWWLFVAQVVLGTSIGDNPPSNIVALAIWLVFGIGLPLSTYYAKLITDVQTDGVFVRFFPLYSRIIALGDIVTYEARQYRPLVEYGGWGIRIGRHKKRAYTMGGNKGVELELTDGTLLLIGSQRPEELANAIATVRA